MGGVCPWVGLRSFFFALAISRSTEAGVKCSIVSAAGCFCSSFHRAQTNRPWRDSTSHPGPPNLEVTIPNPTLLPPRAEDLCVELAPRFFVLPLGPGRDKFEATVKKVRQAHHRHFLVWNFTDQQFKFSDGKPLDPRQFDDQVLEVSDFPGYVPTLTFTFELCNEIRYWLKQDKLNVAILMYEDVAGAPAFDESSLSLSKEGRVAYIASCYLAYSGAVKTTDEGLFQYAAALGKEAGSIPVVPSQVLYYNYIDDIRSKGFTNRDPLLLDCIFVHTVPLLHGSNNCRPVLEITCNSKPVPLDSKYTDIRHPKHPVFVRKDEIMVFEALGLSLWGDVSITCYHVADGFVKKEAKKIDAAVSGAEKVHRDKSPIFRLCFHVGFLQPGGQMQRLKRDDLDFCCTNPQVKCSAHVWFSVFGAFLPRVGWCTVFWGGGLLPETQVPENKRHLSRP